jgi:hypothetical protein
MKTLRCQRCDRRYRGHGAWNLVAEQGVVRGALCPDCQTPEEDAEAAIHEATLDYGKLSDGRITGKPKV